MERDDTPLYHSHCENARAVYSAHCEDAHAAYSARYGTPPPPNPRRPYLQFPPPPPYPPPEGQMHASAPEHYNPAFFRDHRQQVFFDKDRNPVFFDKDQNPVFFEDRKTRVFYEGFRNEGFYEDGNVQGFYEGDGNPTFYEDEAGNIIMQEELELGMHNLAMCIEEDHEFNLCSTPYRFTNADQVHTKKSSKRRLNVSRNDHSGQKMDSFDGGSGSYEQSHRNPDHFVGDPEFQNNSPRFHSKLPEVILKNHEHHEHLGNAEQFTHRPERFSPSPSRHTPKNRKHSKNSESCSPSLKHFFNIAEHLNNSEQFRSKKAHHNGSRGSPKMPTPSPTKPEPFLAQCAPDDFEPDAYSYAYYEPGPHLSNERPGLPPNYRRDPQTRHTYTTRYGTEENIYEEISEVAALASQLNRQHGANRSLQQSQLSLNQSVYEEEVLRVESGHRRVLGELNLTVEDMLMPGGLDPALAKPREEPSPPRPDLLEDLMNVGPTDELLSPMVGEDSGFSGSSAASYHSFKKPMAPRSSQSLPRTQETPVPQSPSLSQGRGYRRLNKSQSCEPPPPPSKPGFWAKKGLKLKAKLSGSSSSKDTRLPFSRHLNDDSTTRMLPCAHFSSPV